MPRTNQEILDQTNDLAAKFYAQWGYTNKKGFRFDQSTHGHEIIAWNQACIAQEELTGTDVWGCIDELNDE